MNFVRIYQLARVGFKPFCAQNAIGTNVFQFNNSILSSTSRNIDSLLTVKRPGSWWARVRHHKGALNNSLPLKTNRERNDDAYLLSNGDSKAISRFRRTRHKFRETKVIVEKKIEDMKENIFTVPNGLCIARMASTPFLGYLVLQQMYVPAVGLFILAGVTDMLDGYIARNFENQKSNLGSFLDPAADKFLVATLFLTLTITGLIPVPLTMLIITRDVCLVGAGFYIRYLSLPAPRTFLRFFNASLATASVSPTLVSKLNTAVQLGLVAVSLSAPVFGYIDHPYLKALWYITAGTTIISGASYIFTKNTYKILSLAKKTTQSK